MFMIRGFALVWIVLILSMGLVDARLPEIGDFVQVMTIPNQLKNPEIDEGIVTGFGDGLICFTTTEGEEGCLGTGFIYSMKILNNTTYFKSFPGQ